MTTHSIQGDLLSVTVIGCSKLKDTELLSRQDPYVCVEYGGNKFQTRTCVDGSKNPNFGDRFVYTLTEGLRELNVDVMNSNNLLKDYFIGSGKIQLVNAISRGFDDSSWPLTTKEGRHAGEIRLCIQYSSVNNMANSAAPPQPSLYSPQPPPPAAGFSYLPTGGYPPPSFYASYPPNSGDYQPSLYLPVANMANNHAPAAPPQPSLYSPQPPSLVAGFPYFPTGGYPSPSSYASYPPNSGGYQPSLYPPVAAIYTQSYPLNPAYTPQPYGPHNHHPPGPHPSPFWPHAK